MDWNLDKRNRMNTTLSSTRHLSLKSIFRFWKSKEKAPVPIEKTERRPQPVEVNKENAVYDQITHTGQVMAFKLT